MRITELQSKTDLILEMQDAYDQTYQLAAEKDAANFNFQPGDRWSIAEQLEHLILSSKGVASALKTPKEQLAAFGTPNGPSRNYDELEAAYQDVLLNGQKAPARFCPREDHQFDQAELLMNWKMIGDKFASRLSGWSEVELDQYCLPHPALGLLTFREMLYATIFHTRHHLKSMRTISAS